MTHRPLESLSTTRDARGDRRHLDRTLDRRPDDASPARTSPRLPAAEPASAGTSRAGRQDLRT